MPQVDLLTEVRNHLPAHQAQTWVSRLRNDPLIWVSLHDETFLNHALSVAGVKLATWSPASLARLAVGDGWVDSTRWVLKPADARIATQLFNEALHDHRMATNLKEAGYLAVALLEQWQQNNNLLSLIETNAGEPEGRLLAIWRTPLACLYGMLSDPMVLLRALLPKKPGSLSIAWISQCVLCNPIELEYQVQIFSNLMTGISPAQQINWLRYLQLAGNIELVNALAKALLTKVPLINTASLAKHAPDKSDLEVNVVRLVELMRQVGLFRYSNQITNARSMAQKASQTLAHLTSRVMLQIADLDLCEGKVEPAIEQILRVMESIPGSKELSTESLMAMTASGVIEPILNNIPAENSSPLVRIYRAKDQYDQGSQAQAREMAAISASQFLDQISAQPVGLVTQYLPDWQPAHVVQTLFKMNLPIEALAIAEKTLDSRPADKAVLEIAAEISFNQHQYLKALEFRSILLMLEPANPARYRQSANLLEKLERWQQAKSVLQQVTELAEPGLEDWIGIGRCSLHLNEWENVLEVSERVLNQEPENGKACSLKGQALVALGRHEEAVRLLNQATLLAPEEAEPWLALAKMQSESGDEQRSMDTMRAAVLAVPTSAEINFRLAKAFIRGGLFSDGLPFLRKAALLAPESVEVALDLGRTLMTLGHYGEAKKVLTQGRQRWPQHATLAYAFAELALQTNEREAALEALDVALQSIEVQPEWFIKAAQTLTGYDAEGFRPEADPGRLITTQLGLDKLVTEHSDHLEAQLLLAEVLLARKDTARAYDIFQSLIESCECQPCYCWRVQVGLGEAALAMGMLENALVSLKDAVQAQPENPRMHRLLAETFKLGRLEQEAASSAQDALKLAPDSLPTLAWYAGLMSQLGDVNEAIQALRTATQLAPHNSLFWLMLAEAYLKQQNYSEAETALQVVQGQPDLSSQIVRRVARAYITLGQPTTALDALQLAKNNGQDPEYPVELAYLFMLNKQYEQAYESLQPALNRLANISWLPLFQADLLIALGRYEAAEACLDRAQKSLEAHQARPAAQMIRSDLLPEEWQVEIQQPIAIHRRFAVLERCKGNLVTALQHAEVAIKAQPENIALRLLAAEIASAMLLQARAAQLADLPFLHQTPVPVPTGSSPEAIADLISLQAESALELGDCDSVEIYIHKGEEINPQFPRLWAVKTRLFVKKGDWHAALSSYRRLNELIGAQDDQGVGCCEHTPAIWQAQAALDVMDWRTAARQMQALAEAHPQEPQSLLGMVKAIVLSVEAGRLCKDLQLVNHRPDIQIEYQVQVDQLDAVLGKLEKLTNPLLVERWRARGQAAFKPTTQNLRNLSNLLPSEDEAAALMSLLRATNNLSGAIQIAPEYSNSAPVNVQLALAHFSADLAQSLLAANRAAEIDPDHPIVLSVLALALEKNGYASEALEIWKSALELWDDEPYWQAKAGALASEVGDLKAAIEYWKNAVKLDTENLDYVAELSKAYLEDGSYALALESLTQATHQNEKRADLWYLLAQANRSAKRLPEALECALKASQLDQAAVQPLLLSGEISLQMGSPDQALGYAQVALSSQPANEAAILFQVKVHESIDQAEEGLNLLEKSITPDSSVNMVVAYARLVYKQRGAQAALPMLKKIAETDPDEIGVLQLLAHAREECGEVAGAVQTAFQALQLDPNQPDLNCLMGRLKRVEGQLDQSVHYLSEAIRQDPDNISAYLELGKTYQDRREMMQALQVYEKAIQANASDHRPYHLAGIVLRESKDYRGAESMLRRAAELAPQDINIRRLLGAVITLNLIHNSQEVSTINEL